ncbi:Peptidase family M1 [Lentzea albidocapillata subsp. violacea]|uniref:Aminopeptidase N n=1 Tax=Lentzea albidocapillata subsp. violacea TaxID=128104 RepID=A0A1G9HSM6_9PSEU|nr:M1 family metallopeptidase [Lentzea albidocapillata]SDL15939.1 Peptidase family M1 [Lentzea albidocapillata subsp. violacea]
MKARPYLIALVLVVLVAGLLVVFRTPDGGPAQQARQETSPQAAVEAGAGAGDAYYPTDGNSGYDVTLYDLAITYDPGSRKLDGVATITATAAQDLSRFNLDLEGLKVSEVKVGGQPAKFVQEGDHELVITPASPLAKSKPFTTVVTYGGEPTTINDASLGRSGWQISSTGGAFAAGQPHSATTWFPANDTPRDKAALKVAARVPDGWTAISNGLEGPATRDGGWTTFTWSEETPLATYLATVAIDKFEVVRSKLPDGTPVVDAYAPGTSATKKPIQSQGPEVLAYLETKFGPYPQRAAGSIWVADQIGFSLETQTRPIYAAWADLETVVHENAHQWFGDSVSIENWADICLNECLASYAQWLWLEKEGTDLDQRYRDNVEQRRDRAAFWAPKLYDMGKGNEFRGVYDKGLMGMHALRKQVGDDVFFKALQTWLVKHRDGNASWPEFEEHFKAASGQPLDGFFAAWFRESGIPEDQYLLPVGVRR